MGIYTIKDSVPKEDVGKLVDFLNHCWKENHALVKSRALLDFQHYDVEKQAYNYIVAENQDTGDYDALVGYIPVSQYDKTLADNGDYWGAIWKRRTDVQNAEINQLGVDVYERLFSLPHFSSHCGISLSEDAVRMCKAMRYKFGYMHQYYIFNQEERRQHIAGNVMEEDYTDASQTRSPGWEVRWLDSLDEAVESGVQAVWRPQKTLTFFENRYGKHPIYRYRFLGLYKQSRLVAVLATRTVEACGGKVLRIVDAIGELGGYIYPSMQRILAAEGMEYADFLNYGIENEVFLNMGFRELDFENDKLVLPNYFEPFERRNIKMTIVIKAKFPYVAFKGDADQDRPNII